MLRQPTTLSAASYPGALHHVGLFFAGQVVPALAVAKRIDRNVPATRQRKRRLKLLEIVVHGPLSLRRVVPRFGDEVRNFGVADTIGLLLDRIAYFYRVE